MYHSRDQTKVMEMMSVQKESLVETEPLTKEKCFEVFKVQQELQMKMMEDMVKNGTLPADQLDSALERIDSQMEFMISIIF